LSRADRRKSKKAEKETKSIYFIFIAFHSVHPLYLVLEEARREQRTRQHGGRGGEVMFKPTYRGVKGHEGGEANPSIRVHK
jgi:hypothetical protein